MSSGRAADRAAPSIVLLLAAFASVYVIWGSTYLAIRVAVQTLPPLTSAGVRFTVAGGLLYAWARWRGGRAPTLRHWRSAAVIGGLMLLGGNGAVVVAETRIHSNVAALLVATVPLWIVLLNALRPGGVCPRALEVIGMLVGFSGVYVLLGPGGGSEESAIHPVGAGLVLFAALAWAVGSLFSRHAELPPNQFLATAIEMIAGGALLLAVGAAGGEWADLDPASFSRASLLALAYLVVFGSIVAFTAYMWLLQVSTPAKVGTYAFVNPVVAVFLGWLILSEPIPPSTLAALGMIVAAVLLIIVARRPWNTDRIFRRRIQVRGSGSVR